MLDLGRTAGVHRELSTDFQGGVRVAAFVSGGLLPQAVRGTVLHEKIHVCDWVSSGSERH